MTLLKITWMESERREDVWSVKDVLRAVRVPFTDEESEGAGKRAEMLSDEEGSEFGGWIFDCTICET